MLLELILYFLFKAGVRTFDDFLSDGLIEYLDVNEQNNALVGSCFISSKFFDIGMVYIIHNYSNVPIIIL